jgi:aminoglycoside phosphotransferase (APT) family kinase protein
MSLFITPFLQQFVLSPFEPGATIAAVQAFGRRTRPFRVQIRRPSGEVTPVVVRTSLQWAGVVTEARLLPTLRELGLPVPQLLAGPAYDPQQTGPAAITSLLGLLPGQSLLEIGLASPAGLEQSGNLVIEAVSRLHSVTEPLLHTRIGQALRRRDLLTELQLITEARGQWAEQAVFLDAVRRLAPALADIRVPLVFSNGDYQPENFLGEDGSVSGILDFEAACLEDPHYGFAIYPIYDIYPLYKAGFVEQYLRHAGLSAREFAPRLALRCLWTLQHRIEPDNEHNGYRDYLLTLLNDSLEKMD